MTDLNEASPEPSTETVMPDAPVDAPDTSLDDELSAIYQENNPDDEAEQQPEDKEASTDEPETEQEAEPEAVELPTSLPVGLKEIWGQLPEDARNTIETAHMDMASKVSQASREVAGLRPIRGALEEAIQANPAIAKMRPEEVASQVPELIRIGQRMSADPVNTILTLAQQHGVLDGLSQALTGQGAPGGMAAQQEIAQLKQEIQSLRDPSWMREQYEAWNAESMTMRDINEFSQGAEFWSEVEPHMAETITLARKVVGDSAPARAVLEKAYDLAVNTFLPDKAKAKVAAPEAATEPDPAKVQKAKDAKSVNVKSQTSGNARSMSLDDELSAIYDRAQA